MISLNSTFDKGGDTERQLLRKVFKHVLDGYFFVVKGTLDNESTKSPLRTLDLTLDSSHNIRGFLWEDEFRRLGRRYRSTAHPLKLIKYCLLTHFITNF